MIIALLGLGIIGTAVVAGITLALDLPILAAVSAAVANIALARGDRHRRAIASSSARPSRTAELLPGP